MSIFFMFMFFLRTRRYGKKAEALYIISRKQTRISHTNKMWNKLLRQKHKLSSKLFENVVFVMIN